MAKVITQQKSGSVGPSTFQSSRNGLIERARVRPLNPRTLAQQNHRSIVASVSSGWRGLTDAGRAGWTALGSQLSEPLTGEQAYNKINILLAGCGLPTLAAAPPLPELGILVCTGLVAEDTPLVRLTQVSNTVAPDAYILEACPPLSPGITYVTKLFRRLAVLPGQGGLAADLDLTAAYTARFGAPAAGQRVVVRITAMKHGFKSAPLQFRTLVTAHGG